MWIFLKRAVVKRIGGNLRKTIHSILVWKLTTALRRSSIIRMESALFESLKVMLIPKTKLLFMMCS